MRITIRLDDELMKELRAVAAEDGATVSQTIEKAIRDSMELRSRGKRKHRPLPTSGGNGVRPGIDLNDTGSLLDAMDEMDGRE